MNIDYNDKNVWQLYHNGYTKGLFQLESNLGRSWSKKVKPNNMYELACLVSLIRPGTLNAIVDGKSISQHYVDRKHNLEPISYPHECLEEVLKPTLGLILFQEQIMAISKIVAGFSGVQADTLRKCVTGDTLFVSKSRGWISINDLIKNGYADDLFLIMDENGKQSWKTIDKIWSTGKHDVNDIETSSGMSVRATKYHQFLTNNGWKARCRLLDDDYIVCAKEIEYDGIDNISENLAIVIAGILTEGYFIEKRSTFVNHNEEIMNIFTNSFYKEFNQNNSGKDKKVFLIKKKERELIHKYVNYGLSQNKKIPSVMMGMTKETTRKFLSFMFAAERGITISSGQVEYSSKSKEMIKQVQLLLLRFGIRSYILSHYNEECKSYYYRLYINDIRDQEKLSQELTVLWPEYKIKNLSTIISNKKCKNYTTDIIPNNIVTKMIDQYPYCGNGESGSLYKENISRNRFKKVASKTEDIFWNNLADGKQQYLKIKSKDKKTKEIETFDFTVSGGDAPYIIANGLVIHNSIGKKDAAKMKEVRLEFIDGAETTNIVDKEIASELFNIIEKSARYLFNLSHGVGYAYMSYWTAYMKYHHTVNFFVSYLRSAHEKQDPHSEISELISESKIFNIESQTPSIAHCNKDIEFLDDKIVFGIKSIKSLTGATGDKVYNTINSICLDIDKKPHELTWMDVLIYISTAISKTSFIGLCSVGFFNGVSRNKALYEYGVLKELTSSELNWVIENYPKRKWNTLLECFIDLAPTKKEGGGTFKEARKNKILNEIKMLQNPPFDLADDVDWIVSEETKFLGCPITMSKSEGLHYNSNTTCKELMDGKNFDKIRLAGTIIKLNNHVIKKEGKNLGRTMSFLTLQDETGSFDEVIIFPDSREENKYSLEEGVTALFCGSRTDGGSFIVKEIIE